MISESCDKKFRAGANTFIMKYYIFNVIFVFYLCILISGTNYDYLFISGIGREKYYSDMTIILRKKLNEGTFYSESVIVD